MRVLLVSHEASRSGAPRIAILLARSLVRDGHDVRIVSRTRGPLLGEMRATGPTRLELLHRVRHRLRHARVTRQMGYLLDTLVAGVTIAVTRPDVVYINSTAAAAYIRPAEWLGRRVILHVHESAQVAGGFLTAARVPLGLDRVELVACSPSVRTDMSKLTGRASEGIWLQLSVPDSDEVIELADATLERDFAADTVVGCCGTVEPRKGPDLWVAAARQVLDRLPDRPMRFIWVGDVAAEVAVTPGEPIEFVGSAANPYPFLKRFDIATLPSRDDPFPLVVLEAMTLGTPIVAFDVGGVAQQVGNGGLLVPAGDVDGFADAIVTLVENQLAREEKTLAARERVATYFSVKAFSESLRALMASGSPEDVAATGPAMERMR
jgi:glycosyltransferase involved in cell wall biosynthesis